MRAAAGLSVLSLLSFLRVAPAAAQERAPTAAPPLDPRFVPIESAGTPPPVEENAEAQPPPPPPGYTEGNIDYDVTYDDSVAQSYDDGYDPQAAAQFEETLAPYGTWVDDDVYGRVWQPSGEVVGDDFSPYATAGHWLMTEYGWTWISDYDWGWAPFHYGRWLAVAERGWCWMPGTLWGPAWVSWRAGGGYVGWAPLAPRRMSVGSPLGPGSAWRFAIASDSRAPLRIHPVAADGAADLRAHERGVERACAADPGRAGARERRADHRRQAAGRRRDRGADPPGIGGAARAAASRDRAARRDASGVAPLGARRGHRRLR